MPKVGGKRKKSRTHKETTENDETSTGQKIAKTFILKRGDVPNPSKTIIGDMREVMYPHTAMKMRESSKNKIKDYLQIGKGFGVSHMVLFSATETSNYMRLVKLPEGPTLTFRVMNYSSHKDIVSSQKKPKMFGRTLAAPLLILNGFNNVPQSDADDNRPTPSHYNLAYLMIQNMFPPLDLAKARIHNSEKAVLFSLDHETDLIDFRYYGLKVQQAGINKNIKQLLEAKTVPNLKGYKDISEYILREQDNISENEIEDTLEDDTKSRGDKPSNKMTVKLHEIGPRLSLKLIKIEEGLMGGNVVYHRFIKKSTKEVEENRKKIKEKLKRKEEVKKKQQDIVNEKVSKKLKREEQKRKKEFLEEQHEENEGEGGEDATGYTKENDLEEEEFKQNRPKKAFDLSKGGVDLEDEDEGEDEGDDLGEEDVIEEEDDEAQEEEEDDPNGPGAYNDVDEYD